MTAYQPARIIRNLSHLAAIVLLLVPASMALEPAEQAAVGALHGATLAIAFFTRADGNIWQRSTLIAIISVFGALSFYYSWTLLGWTCFVSGLAMGSLFGGFSKRLLLLSNVLLQALLLSLIFFHQLPELLGILDLLPSEEIAIVMRLIFFCWCVSHIATLLSDDPELPDLLVALATFFLMLILALLVATQQLLIYDQHEYLFLVLRTSIGGALLASLIWLVWKPPLGTGIAELFFRHIISLSIPIEEWQDSLSRISVLKKDAREFWSEAMSSMLDCTNLTGVIWEESDGERKVGEEGSHSARLGLANLNLSVCSNHRLQHTERLNLWLLSRTALEYRQVKEREAHLESEARMRSIHELGARTTHDLKNLLQVLTLICSADKNETVIDDRRRKQLLALTSRLETTLGRLKGDHFQENKRGEMPARLWWDRAQEQNEYENVTFKTPENFDFEVPAELFDRALENLLHNALRKQGKEGRLDIEVSFGLEEGLTVRDNGTQIPQEKLAKLFKSPLPSADGMGIGLYQLSQNARKLDYELLISSNSTGDVALAVKPKR